jgi:hypothetical protein
MRKIARVVLPVLIIATILIGPPDAASAHRRELSVTYAVATVGILHDSFRVCHLGPSYARGSVILVSGERFNYYPSNGCANVSFIPGRYIRWFEVCDTTGCASGTA